jgi:mRNA interferase RelE/StbE
VSYTLTLKESAQRELDALPERVRSRVEAKIQTLRDEPRPRGCVKMAGTTNEYRVRVGQYRVVYTVDDRTQAVTVIGVGHRRDVYRA